MKKKEQKGKIRRERGRERTEERRTEEKRNKDSGETLKDICKNLPFVGVGDT